METNTALERLKRVGADQFGIFTVAQAAAAGVDAATLEELCREFHVRFSVDGAYKLHGYDTHHDVTYALWLMLDPETPLERREPPGCGVLSHATAGDWLDTYDDGVLDVTFPLEASLPPNMANNRIHVHRANLKQDEWFIHQGVPVTTPARMVMDLLDTRDEDETAIGRRLVMLALSGMVDFDRLSVQLDGYADRQGRGDGRAFVKMLRNAARSDSALKHEWLR
ncbi:MAG TPA: hypothetical protein VHU91_01980 [Mycobacteriales bacterium]|jgi:hypothetical protein|nr:hypothetical protein [Mycobacteriales bacterium]